MTNLPLFDLAPDAPHQVRLCGPRFAFSDNDGQGVMPIEGCHRLLHRIGRRSFELRMNVDLDSAAAATLSRFQLLAAGADGEET